MKPAIKQPQFPELLALARHEWLMRMARANGVSDADHGYLRCRCSDERLEGADMFEHLSAVHGMKERCARPMVNMLVEISKRRDGDGNQV